MGYDLQLCDNVHETEINFVCSNLGLIPPNFLHTDILQSKTFLITNI